MSTKKRKKEHQKINARGESAPTPGSTVSASSFDEGVYCAACGKYVGFVEVKHVLEHCFLRARMPRSLPRRRRSGSS
jgi:hypothetical protein